ARRLVNASTPEFRPLIRAALLRGCRYGEITSLRASWFDADAGVLTLHARTTGKVRHVPLTTEGVQFFTEQTAGLRPGDLIFRRADGEPWKKSDQIRRMNAASKAAKIEPPVSFHLLRHTFGSLLARAGVPLQVIS